MAYIIPGNIYINGNAVTFSEAVDEKGRTYKYLILSYYERNIIEFLGSLTLSMKNRYDATRTEFTISMNSNGDNPAYIDIADIMSRYFHKGYNDFYQPVSSVPVVVEESAMTVDAILISGGTNISFKLVLIQSSSNEIISKWCQSAYYTGEGQEFYVYYFAKDGEPPEEFEWEDPFEAVTEEVYCCDNLGPALDVDSNSIDNSGTTSLENGVGATFLCDDNNSFPFKNTLSGIDCKLVSGTYPHTSINNLVTIRTQISSFSVAEGDEEYLKYANSQYLYYDRYNTDFSSNIGDILVFENGWQCTIVDAFDGILPNVAYVKHFVIVDKPIMPYWGILSQAQNPYPGGNYWRDMFGYEKIYDATWEYYDYGGELANNENLNRLRCFITENEEDYIPEAQKLYTFDIDISSLFNLVLHPNNIEFGTATGGGPYQFGEYATITAIPSSGYEFTSWDDHIATPTVNPNRYQVYEDTVINVNFFPVLQVENFHIDSTSRPTTYFLIADVVDNVAERGFLIKAGGVPTLEDYDEKIIMEGDHINKLYTTEESVYVVAYSTYRGQAVYSQSEQIIINPSPIPSAYQLVEWLKGTGNPRISTGIKDNNISKIEAMWRCSQTTTTGGFAWTGTLQTSPSVRCGWGIRNSNGHLEAWWGTYANTQADFGVYDKTDTALKQITIDVTNKTATFNGGSPVALGNGTLATTGQNFYLFYDSDSSTLPSTQYFYNVKIYNLQGNLVRDLYPVRRISDNVGMMYDLVSNEVFANIFVGSFEVGPDKQWPSS